MNKRQKGMVYSLWTTAILVVLVLALFSIIFASCTQARVEVPVTTETPPVETEKPAKPAEETPGGETPTEPQSAVTDSPGETAPAVETAPPVILAETEDMGQEYVDKFVFIGDSTTYSLKYHELVKGNQVWTPASGTLTLDRWSYTMFVNWDTGEELMLTAKLDAVQPEYMLVTLGLNGVSFLDEEQFTYHYSELIKAVKEHSPNTRIILNSIYPVGTSYQYLQSINNEKIDAANEWVKAIAETNGVRYLDSQSILKGSDGNLPDDMDMDDGLHLSKDAMAAVLTYLRTHGYK